MNIRSVVIFCAALALPAIPAMAQVDPLFGVMPSYRTPLPKITAQIANQGVLMTALSQAKGGEVFGLAPGDYAIELKNRTFASPVTFTSAVQGNPARVKRIDLVEVSNLTLTRLEITRDAKPGEVLEAGFIAKVTGGTNIVFDANYIHGSRDNNPANDVTGLSISGTRNAKVINNEFTELGRAAIFGSVKDSVIANNKVHLVRCDGFDFAQSRRLLIDGNHFSDSKPAKLDHPDAIQFWTAGTTRPSTDIVIRNNQIMQGHGGGTQGIFMRDESDKMAFERVTIENNLMIGSYMANGIYLSNGVDVVIRNNTILSRTDDKYPVWIRLVHVKNVTHEGNIAELGGNKTPGGAKINMKLLDRDSFRDLKAEDVIVPGIGYQLPN
jgi:hypothetical protein